MSITLELPPEIEEVLTAQARARGLQLDVYVRVLIEERAATAHRVHTMTPAEVDAELDELARDSEKLPYLPPEALTRESIYKDHE